jgi:hypothetical protein
LPWPLSTLALAVTLACHTSSPVVGHLLLGLATRTAAAGSSIILWARLLLLLLLLVAHVLLRLCHALLCLSLRNGVLLLLHPHLHLQVLHLDGHIFHLLLLSLFYS